MVFSKESQALGPEFRVGLKERKDEGQLGWGGRTYTCILFGLEVVEVSTSTGTKPQCNEDLRVLGKR